MNAYERVKLSRERTKDVFPLPGVSDCIRYAICEMAEMDDAWLRFERMSDKRNNVRISDPYLEFGQALYMLYSAAVQMGMEPEYDTLYFAGRMTMESMYAYAMYRMTVVLSTMQLTMVEKSRLQSEFNGAYTSLLVLGELFGWDTAEAVEDACAAFEVKHLGTVKEEA